MQQILQIELRAVVSFTVWHCQIMWSPALTWSAVSLLSQWSSNYDFLIVFLFINCDTLIYIFFHCMICSAKDVHNNIWEHKKKEVYNSCKDYYSIKGFL